MPRQLRAFAIEPVREELAHRRFGVRQGDQAVAKVSWGRNAKFLTEPAGGAAVVRDRDDRSDAFVAVLETTEQRGKTGPAADRDNVQGGPARTEAMLCDDL